MRNLDFLVTVPLLVVPLALWQCSGNDATSTPAADGGVEASSGDDDADLGDDTLGDDAGPTINCDLGVSSGTTVDPVSLCFQKQVIQFVMKSAVTTAGVAASWDSTTFQPTSDGGTVVHDWRDDAAFGSALADYLDYASKYGDNEIDFAVANALVQIATALEAELATLPDEYDGEPYMHLRNVVAGLRFVGDAADAASIEAITEAYGNAIVATYLQPLGGGDMIIGRCSAPSVCTYETEKTATAALAILDMAWRSTFTDAGVPLDATAPPALTTAATAVLAHLALHAVAPSGLYYRALVTSGASGDAGGADGGPSSSDTQVALDTWPADALLSEVQATTMYALARAGTLVIQHSALAAAATFPFFADAESIYAAMHATPSLWDATLGGYYEAYVPSTGALYMDKPSDANALMYAALAYDFIENPPPANPDGGSLAQTDELASQRKLLTQVGMMSSSLITVIANQQAFFRASSGTFGLAYAYDGTGMPTTPEPGASLYRASATSAVLEGLSAQAIGVSDLQ